MSSPSNTQRLKDLMSRHSLSCKDVAILLNRSLQSVYEWRCPNARTISDNLLELLEMKLAQAHPQETSAYESALRSLLTLSCNEAVKRGDIPLDGSPFPRITHTFEQDGFLFEVCVSFCDWEICVQTFVKKDGRLAGMCVGWLTVSTSYPGAVPGLQYHNSGRTNGVLHKCSLPLTSYLVSLKIEPVGYAARARAV